MPSAAAAWFSLDQIHEIEKDSLPEFFNGRFPSKTPAVYKEYRNFMILLYRQYPQAYLTATSKLTLTQLFSLQKASGRWCLHHSQSARLLRIMGSDQFRSWPTVETSQILIVKGGLLLQSTSKCSEQAQSCQKRSRVSWQPFRARSAVRCSRLHQKAQHCDLKAKTVLCVL